MKNPIPPAIQLSIVTVNFGSATKIRKLWSSLEKFPPEKNWEFIVVDNPTKSGDDGKILEKFFEKNERAHVIRLAENLGYGGGNAEGVRFARGEILAIVNPDVEILAETWTPLLHEIENKKTGIAVPVLETSDGKILENCRKFPSPIDLIRRRLFGKNATKNIRASGTERARAIDADWSQGSFWVLRKNLFEKLNGFDPRFFLFLEDTDFCRRVGKSGKKIVQIPAARAIHSPNRLSGGNLLKSLGRKTFWIHLQSAAKYFWKWRRHDEKLKMKN
ncbi:glycosyltransferase [bacterium]|jgi:GT2 family glycosyltransferase|nr:glycosyltransferase [bacterium]MBT6832024.1 glycosyltransferase [bacterium]MBT6995805.1 glycosyltransferase [bacterium]MBT7772384.1 glycosyltransferase [bacterium]